MSISKNKIKMIRSLGDKKNRDELGLFIAEGGKIVHEMLQSSYPVDILLAGEAWIKANESKLTQVKEVYAVDEDIFKKVSQQSTPGDVLVVVRKSKITVNVDTIHSQLSLVLDDIQDPGNLGTIMRIADWFGIPHVICSENTVDIYNPKVIQSSMGAFLRVKSIHYNLDNFFKQAAIPGFDIYGTFLDGKNIYNEKVNTTGIIIMGNESKGINPKLMKYINRKLMIPGFPPKLQGAESLNVSVATGIICAEFRRRMI
jgi:RNA methyltransferase, TrmH family